MMKYDYKIIRDEGDEQITYVPKLSTQIPALTYIEGPNSSGKSTLLNLLGVAFGGNKRKDINETLKARMDSLVNAEHQKVEFTIEIDEHGEILSIKKDLDSKKISFRLNGKIVSPEKVQEKYNLIYDIPEDPINRLSQLVNSIKINQEQMSLKLNSFRAYLQTQLNEVKNSRNPEKIKEKQKEILDSEAEMQKLGEEIINQKELLKIRKSYYYVHWYKDNLAKLINVEKQIKVLESNSIDIQKKLSGDIKKIQTRVNSYIRICEGIKDKVSEDLGRFIKESDQIMEVWNEIDYQEIKKTNIVPNRYFNTISAIVKQLEVVKNSVDTTKRKNYEMWQQIINILENADDSQTKVPGVDKKLNEFLDSLKKETIGLKNEIDRITKAEVLLEKLNELEEDMRILSNRILPEYLKVIKESPNVIDISSSYDDDYLHDEKKQYNKKTEKYRKDCITNGIDIDNEDVVEIIKSNFFAIDPDGKYNRFNENQSETYLVVLENSLVKNMNQFDKIVNMKNYLSNELKTMISAPEHKYSNRSLDITKLINLNLNLKQRMDSYCRQIDDLSNENTKLEHENKHYYPFVFKYLGHKIGFVRHIEGVYEIEYVDLFKKEMLTVGGKQIRFADMGTGQSQSAYLIGKLNTLDHRKVIALIDEVAMMDKKSLAPIYTKLRELYNAKKLLAAIVVQKSDELTVREI